MTDSITTPDRMTRIEAAAFLTVIGYPIAVKTLAQMASRGHRQGPPYRTFNSRVIYEGCDLIAWAETQLSPKARTTAEHEDLARQRAA